MVPMNLVGCQGLGNCGLIPCIKGEKCTERQGSPKWRKISMFMNLLKIVKMQTFLKLIYRFITIIINSKKPL